MAMCVLQQNSLTTFYFYDCHHYYLPHLSMLTSRHSKKLKSVFSIVVSQFRRMASSTTQIDEAVTLLLDCDALLFTSGAGMGVGSGLGTFRGIAAGVWPPLLEHPQLDFTDMSDPSWFNKPQGNNAQHDTANFGYAFWAYRYNAYTSAAPHRGYTIAQQWSKLPNVKHSFSFTSNIDGHWIKSGWNRSAVVECHGSIDNMQCVENCSDRLWPTGDALKLQVDPKTNCVIDPLPKCPDCNRLARPNVLMFGDFGYFGQRYNEQHENYDKFHQNLGKNQTKLLIIELGAGTAVPTVRMEGEHHFIDSKYVASMIRINPSAEHVSIPTYRRKKSEGKGVELTVDALRGLTLIDDALKKRLNK